MNGNLLPALYPPAAAFCRTPVKIRKYLAVLVLPVLLAFTPPAIASPVSFVDDFNRPDSSTAGNGWSSVSGSLDGFVNGNMGIVGNTLYILDSGTSGYGNIYRPFDFSDGVRVRADLTAGLNGRYKEMFTFFNDGTFVIHGLHGIEIFLSRSNNSINNSVVAAFVNGTQVGSISSPFQFGQAIAIDFSYMTDGTITGTVTGDGNTFDFNFSTGTAPGGSNFMYSSNYIAGGQQGLDNLQLDPLTTSASPTSTPEPASLSVLLASLTGLALRKARVYRRDGR